MSYKFYFERNISSINIEGICYTDNKEKPIFTIYRSVFRQIIGRPTIKVYKLVNSGREKEKVATIKQPLFPYFFKSKQKIKLNSNERLVAVSKEVGEKYIDPPDSMHFGTWRFDIESLGWSTYAPMIGNHVLLSYLTIFDDKDSVFTCKLIEEQERKRCLYEVEVFKDEDILKCLCVIICVIYAVLNSPDHRYFNGSMG